MKKKKELTWEDLRIGAQKLQEIFDRSDYGEGRFLVEKNRNGKYVFLRCYEKESLRGFAKEDPIIENKVSDNSGQILRLEVYAFARSLYDILISRELDESEILDIGEVRWGLAGWKDPNLDKIKFFQSYEAVYDKSPDLLNFGVYNVDSLSKEEKERAIKILDKESEKLRVGGAIKIEGIKNLRELGLQSRLDNIFRYEGDRYCTIWPETHMFKRDLERAVQYEMLFLKI